MTKVQNRRGVSFNREVFETVKAHCKKHNIPMSRFVTEAVRVALIRAGTPLPNSMDKGRPGIGGYREY